MARGTTLANIRTMLKAEIGYDAGANAIRDQELNVLLSNKQKWLATEYDWPFLEQRYDMQVNGRTVDLPVTNNLGIPVPLNFDRPVKVEVFFNDKWQDVEYGIGSEEFNYMDSDHHPGEPLDPIQKWRFNENVSVNNAAASTIEVWPIPATPQTLRMTGQRVPAPLESDTDPADFDDMLLVMFVAGERLMRLRQADAQEKLKLAADRLQRLRSVYPSRYNVVVLGKPAQTTREMRRVVPMIIVSK